MTPRAAAAALSLLTLALVAPARPVAAGAPPTVRLTHGGAQAVAARSPGEQLEIDLGAVVESAGGAFELHVRRNGTATQVVRDSRGTPQAVRTLPHATRSLAEGLRAFFLVEVRDDAGAVVARTHLPFCPASRRLTRVDGTGPATPAMPSACAATALTRAVVWGIDAGWGVVAPTPFVLRTDLPDGSYAVTLSIARRWAGDLGVPAGASTVRIPLEVVTTDPDAHRAGHRPEAAARGTQDVRGGGVPDLVALPPWHVRTAHDETSGVDLLTFAASVWNAGDGPLVVEGFRDPGADTMHASQHLYEGGEPVTRLPAGTLRYHRAGGHDHWHFDEFARYSLVDLATGASVRSQKEAFCLTPTDPVDLTLPGAEWNPATTSLASACGEPDSTWIRQVLPVGWADTYVQTVAGQSFDVTSLPNGDYVIEIAANPEGRLLDHTGENDVASRRVRLGGEPGARSVRVLSPG